MQLCIHIHQKNQIFLRSDVFVPEKNEYIKYTEGDFRRDKTSKEDPLLRLDYVLYERTHGGHFPNLMEILIRNDV